MTIRKKKKNQRATEHYKSNQSLNYRSNTKHVENALLQMYAQQFETWVIKWIFYFLRIYYLSSITANVLSGLDCIYE
jgi:hypothetical protein